MDFRGPAEEKVTAFGVDLTGFACRRPFPEDADPPVLRFATTGLRDETANVVYENINARKRV